MIAGNSRHRALTVVVIVFVNSLGYGRNAAADAAQERATDDICLSYSSPWTVQENHAERLVDNADAAAAAFDCTTGPDYGFSQY